MGGHHGHTQFQRLATKFGKVDLAVLRTAALGNVQPGHDLDARHQRATQLGRQPQIGLQLTVLAKPDRREGIAPVGFDVDVGRMGALRLGDHLVHQPHHAGRFTGRTQLLGLAAGAHLDHGLHHQVFHQGLLILARPMLARQVALPQLVHDLRRAIGMTGMRHTVLHFQAALDGFAAGPHEAHRVTGLGAQLAVQFVIGGCARRHKKLLVGHAQRHHMEAVGSPQGQDGEGIALGLKPQHFHLDHTRHPRQRPLQLVVGQHQSVHQLMGPRAQQIGVFRHQFVQGGFFENAQMRQRVPQTDDGQTVLCQLGIDELGQRVDQLPCGHPKRSQRVLRSLWRERHCKWLSGGFKNGKASRSRLA